MEKLERTLESINKNKETIEKTKKELKENKKRTRGRIVVFLAREFSKLRKIKSVSKEKIKRKKRIIKLNEKKLNTACDFDFEDLTNFVIGVLSLKENTEYYKYTLFIPKADFSSTYQSIGSNYLSNKFYEVCLITTEENFEKLDSLSSLELYQLGYNPDKIFDDRKYILLHLSSRYNFYDSFKSDVNFSQFKNFPYLKNIIEKIIEERLTTGISDNNSLDITLNKYADDYVRKNTYKKSL